MLSKRIIVSDVAPDLLVATLDVTNLAEAESVVKTDWMRVAGTFCRGKFRSSDLMRLLVMRLCVHLIAKLATMSRSPSDFNAAVSPAAARSTSF
jgi:hypothetical protein